MRREFLMRNGCSEQLPWRPLLNGHFQKFCLLQYILLIALNTSLVLHVYAIKLSKYFKSLWGLKPSGFKNCRWHWLQQEFPGELLLQSVQFFRRRKDQHCAVAHFPSTQLHLLVQCTRVVLQQCRQIQPNTAPCGALSFRTAGSSEVRRRAAG